MSTLGRPTRFRPEYCALARNYCMLGAINDELAEFFEVAPSTIDNWIASQPEFAAAVRKGRSEADAGVVGRLYKRAMGYDHEGKREVLYKGKAVELRRHVHYPADVRACIFWLRNRCPQHWRETASGRDQGYGSRLSFEELEERSERADRITEEYERRASISPPDVASG